MLPVATTGRSALVSALREGNQSFSEFGSSDKPKQFCDYCQQPGHIIANCWKLHSCPPSRRGSRSTHCGHGWQSHAHHTSGIDDTSLVPTAPVIPLPSTSTPRSATTFEDAQCGLEALRTLVTQSCSVYVHRCFQLFCTSNLLTSSQACLSHSSFPWIIDSGGFRSYV